MSHGGSGSSADGDKKEAIGYGVIKMNIDTDLQMGDLPLERVGLFC